MREGVDVIRFVWAHLRGRAGRAVALLVGVLTATTGFTVLTGATATARLEVTGTVDANVRAAYDILVRPKGSRLPLEDDRALLRPNAVSGIYGGLTMDDWAKVRAVPGIDVAAPIAMAGSVNAAVAAPVDLTDLVDPALDRQVIRVDRTLLADRGLSRVAGHPDLGVRDQTRRLVAEADRRPRRRVHRRAEDPVQAVLRRQPRRPGGRPAGVPVPRAGPGHRRHRPVRVPGPAAPGRAVRRRGCLVRTADAGPPGHLRRVARADAHRRRRPGGRGPARRAPRRDPGHLPERRAARTTGPAAARTKKVVPVLATSRRYADTTASIALSRARLDAPLPAAPPTACSPRWRPHRRPTSATTLLDTEAAYAHTTAAEVARGGEGYGFVYGHEWLLQVGGVTYLQAPDGSLAAVPVPHDQAAYVLPHSFGFPAPWQIDDTSFRTVRNVSVRAQGDPTATEFGVVGTFDPSRLTTFNPLSRVPMETYEPPLVVGADQRTRDLLGDRAARTRRQPRRLPVLAAHAADQHRRAAGPARRHAGHRQGRAAERRSGSVSPACTASPTPPASGSASSPRRSPPAPASTSTSRTARRPPRRPSTLVAGRYQRPELRVTEHWVKKGVAASIITAIDRKSAVLFVLVLVVCALFLANAVAAGVRDRRTELATLSALGWPAHRIFAAVLGEVATIGTVAGLGALALAGPLGALLDVRTTWTQALLAVPTAVVLSLIAGLLPALGAARGRPAAGLRPAVARPRRAGRPAARSTMGLLDLVRVPGRTGLGAGALAIGIAAATVLGAITFTFHGAIVGTLLGDAVSLRVRAVDTIAVGGHDPARRPRRGRRALPEHPGPRRRARHAPRHRLDLGVPGEARRRRGPRHRPARRCVRRGPRRGRRRLARRRPDQRPAHHRRLSRRRRRGPGHLRRPRPGRPPAPPAHRPAPRRGDLTVTDSRAARGRPWVAARTACGCGAGPAAAGGAVRRW